MKVARGIATPILPLMGGGVRTPNAALIIGSELDGFALDFLDNSYAVKTTSASEKLLLQLGDEWRGFAMDFTSDLYAIRTAPGAETLLGTGPDAVEPQGFGLDFTDNSSSVRN